MCDKGTKPALTISRPIGWIVALALGMAVLSGTVRGDVRLLVPEESPSGPFYARLERGLVHQDGGWVAIAFYRNPGCVSAAFNLLNFFDFANIPAIFSCSLTVPSSSMGSTYR